MSSNNVIEPPAILGNPTQIACFSVSDETVTANSIASLQYFKEPTQNALLTQGCHTFLRRYKSDLKLYHPRPLDNIFTALDSGNKDIFRHADVVTWRGIIVKSVAILPNYRALNFIRIMLGTKMKLNMSFIDGVLYLDEHDPEPNRSVSFDHHTVAI